MALYYPFEPNIKDFNFYEILTNKDQILLSRSIFATEILLNELPKKSKVHNITIEQYNEGYFNEKLEETKVNLSNEFIRF